MPSAVQAIVDDFLEKAGGVLFARDPLFADRERDLAVAQQAGADIMVVRVYPEDIGVLFRHGPIWGNAPKQILRRSFVVLFQLIGCGLQLVRIDRIHAAASSSTGPSCAA